MKVLILGAKGMLGQALLEVFKKDYEVAAWDREEIDITENQNSKIKIQKLRPDLIVNAAAYNDVDRAEAEPEIAKAVNSAAVGYLAKTCEELSTPLIHYSTAYVFDGKKPNGYTEDDAPDPLSVYGESKLEGEKQAVKAGKYYILRLDRLFGKSGGGKKSFVENILKFASEQKEIKVINDEFGSPTYAPDLAKRTKFIFENRDKLRYGIYHCANYGSCSWYEWAKEIFQIKQIQVPLKGLNAPQLEKEYKRAARRPKYSILLNTKLPRMPSWQEALREFLVSNY